MKIKSSKLKLIFPFSLFVFSFLIFSSRPAKAITPTECIDCQEVHNPILSPELSALSGIEFFQKAISVAINFVFVIGGLVFFFLLIAGAIKWITSGGDKASLESAQKTITNALIGLAILLSVFVIISLIEQLFGVNITSFKLPTLAQ